MPARRSSCCLTCLFHVSHNACVLGRIFIRCVCVWVGYDIILELWWKKQSKKKNAVFLNPETIQKTRTILDCYHVNTHTQLLKVYIWCDARNNNNISIALSEWASVWCVRVCVVWFVTLLHCLIYDRNLIWKYKSKRCNYLRGERGMCFIASRAHSKMDFVSEENNVRSSLYLLNVIIASSSTSSSSNMYIAVLMLRPVVIPINRLDNNNKLMRLQNIGEKLIFNWVRRTKWM